jgi:hypothetical protein
MVHFGEITFYCQSAVFEYSQQLGEAMALKVFYYHISAFSIDGNTVVKELIFLGVKILILLHGGGDIHEHTVYKGWAFFLGEVDSTVMISNKNGMVKYPFQIITNKSQPMVQYTFD